MITTEGLAEKIDVAEVEAENALPRAELESDIAAPRRESMTWILGAMGLQTVLVIGSLFAFVPMIAK